MNKILLLTITLTLFINGANAQSKEKIFYDSLGQVTTFENHWSQIVTGRYKTVYNKKENKKTLTRTTEKEFQDELNKTEKRITINAKLGTDFPDFDLFDLDGNRISKKELIGKVLVINFWFVGCSPCEMERPSLNNLTKIYADNKDVVFISFARNTKEEVDKFLKENPILYKIIPTEKDYIKTKFDSNAYPVNIIVDKEGKYFYNSSPTGIGIVRILQEKIDRALKG